MLSPAPSFLLCYTRPFGLSTCVGLETLLHTFLFCFDWQLWEKRKGKCHGFLELAFPLHA